MSNDLKRMKDVQDQIPMVLVHCDDDVIRLGRVRVNLKRGCCIVVVKNGADGPMLFEFSGQAIRRAVAYGEVLMG